MRYPYSGAREGARIEARSVQAARRERVLFCTMCGVQVDAHDVDAALAAFGVFDGRCSDCQGDRAASDTPLGRGRRVV